MVTTPIQEDATLKALRETREQLQSTSEQAKNLHENVRVLGSLTTKSTAGNKPKPVSGPKNSYYMEGVDRFETQAKRNLTAAGKFTGKAVKLAAQGAWDTAKFIAKIAGFVVKSATKAGEKLKLSIEETRKAQTEKKATLSREGAMENASPKGRQNLSASNPVVGQTPIYPSSSPSEQRFIPEPTVPLVTPEPKPATTQPEQRIAPYTATPTPTPQAQTDAPRPTANPAAPKPAEQRPPLNNFQQQQQRMVVWFWVCQPMLVQQVIQGPFGRLMMPPTMMNVYSPQPFLVPAPRPPMPQRQPQLSELFSRRAELLNIIDKNPKAFASLQKELFELKTAISARNQSETIQKTDALLNKIALRISDKNPTATPEDTAALQNFSKKLTEFRNIAVMQIADWNRPLQQGIPQPAQQQQPQPQPGQLQPGVAAPLPAQQPQPVGYRQPVQVQPAATPLQRDKFIPAAAQQAAAGEADKRTATVAEFRKYSPAGGLRHRVEEKLKQIGESIIAGRQTAPIPTPMRSS